MVGVATKDAVAVDGVLNGVRPLPLQFFKAGGRRQAAGRGSGETGLDSGARHFATHGAASQLLAAPLIILMAQEASPALSTSSAPAEN